MIDKHMHMQTISLMINTTIAEFLEMKDAISDPPIIVRRIIAVKISAFSWSGFFHRLLIKALSKTLAKAKKEHTISASTKGFWTSLNLFSSCL